MIYLIYSLRKDKELFFLSKIIICILYGFKSGILDSVERINLDKKEFWWENIIVDNKVDANLKFYSAGIIRINQMNNIFNWGNKRK